MKKLVIIGTVWPEPNSTAAGQRMLQLISFFINQKYAVVFACSASKSDFSFRLETLQISTVEIKLNDPSFDDFIQVENPDMILFDRFITEEQFGWRISKYCPKTIQILDSEDLHFLREARAIAFKNKEICTLNHLQNDIAKREIASIYRCDLTLIISTYEIDVLQNTFGIPSHLLLYLPLFYDEKTTSEIEKLTTFESRNHFISIGNFLHQPNWHAVLELKNHIWPLIKKEIAEAELHVYGAYVTPKALQLHNKKEGFIIKGRAESSKIVFENAKVLLAPLPFGAGIKGKLVESMLFGTPNVTSSIGAEGMKQNENWNGYISDDYATFAQNAIELYQNKEKWLIAQKNGFSLIHKNFNKTKFEKEFAAKINDLENNFETSRKNNFMGQILQHHLHKSTYYLSKWIEEKNKNAIRE